jgi:hypothetical protein
MRHGRGARHEARDAGCTPREVGLVRPCEARGREGGALHEVGRPRGVRHEAGPCDCVRCEFFFSCLRKVQVARYWAAGREAQGRV